MTALPVKTFALAAEINILTNIAFLAFTATALTSLLHIWLTIQVLAGVSAFPLSPTNITELISTTASHVIASL